MLNKFFIFNVFLFTFCAMPSANANYTAEQCNVHYEMVTKLHHPDIGAYSVWEATYGEGQKDEEFVSAINHGDGVLAVGKQQSIKGGDASMMFAMFNNRGRMVWDKYHAISGIKNIVKMLPSKDGVLVLINRHKRRGENKSYLWIGFFDNSGSLKAQKTIRDKDHDLFATDIISSIRNNGKKGWVISVTVERSFGRGKSKVIRKNAAIYLLDEKGNEISNRSYVLGTNNEISDLAVSKFNGESDGYIATGYFETPSGKKVGWALRLNRDASYVWQREYGRGLSAKLKLASPYNSQYILVFGDVRPVDSGSVGSWLMLLDSNDGNVMWQRYYYGETGFHDYSASGLYVNSDGLITLMMMARSTNKLSDHNIHSVFDNSISDFMDYAHVLTLNPRGVTFDGDAYYFGKGAYISQLIEGVAGGRVMVGYALVPSGKIFINKSEDAIDALDDIIPLQEEGIAELPDVELSDKANAGLAMLKNRIKEQKIDLESKEKSGESANDMGDGASLTRDAWVVIGDMTEAYTDPCRREIKGLK